MWLHFFLKNVPYILKIKSRAGLLQWKDVILNISKLYLEIVFYLLPVL